MSTSIHTQPTARPATAPTYTPAQAAFFRVLGHEEGAREIVAGTVNASGAIELVVWTARTFRQDGKAHTRVWIEPQHERRAAREVRTLESTWGNVYASVGTYAKAENPYKPGQLRYCRDVPLPRYCFILDDVRDLAALRLRPTMVVETSKGNYQAIYRCDVLLSPRDATQLATGAALLAGCDESGADATQIIRIPDTRNTKPKCGPDGWHVRLVYADGPTYSRSALAKAFLPNGLPTPRATTGTTTSTSTADRTVGTGDEPWRDPAWRAALRRAADQWVAAVVPGQLLDANSIPKGLAPKPGEDATQYKFLGYRIFIGEHRSISPSGNWDASRDRWNGIKSLMGRGYNDGQIAAIAESKLDYGAAVKGTEAIWLDICRSIYLIDKDMGDKRRIRATQPAQSAPATAAPEPKPHINRARKDRPGLLGGAPALLERYHAAPMLCDLPQTERAKVIGVSLATIKRLEAQLVEAQRIEHKRATTPNGWALRVLILADVDPTPLSSQSDVCGIVAPLAAEE